MTDDPDDETDIEALRRRYDQLEKMLDWQTEAAIAEGKHYRRMFRVLVLLFGALITGMTYLTSTGDLRSPPIISKCVLEVASVCISAGTLVATSFIGLLSSTIFYAINAHSGPIVGAPDDEVENLDWNTEREFLEQRNEIMEKNINENYQSFSRAREREEPAEFAIIAGLFLLGVVGFSFLTREPVSIVVLTITVLLLVAGFLAAKELPER